MSLTYECYSEMRQLFYFKKQLDEYLYNHGCILPICTTNLCFDRLIEFSQSYKIAYNNKSVVSDERK